MIRAFILFSFLIGMNLATGQSISNSKNTDPLQQDMHGYYVIPGRIQGWNLKEWKAAFDCFANDSINAVIFWIPGSFRSKKFLKPGSIILIIKILKTISTGS